ncbi:MAG: arsenate reductase ArsC [Candidatus Acidiferrum sp.]|jgi:arsenate reductase
MRHKPRILFFSTGDSARSQMAEGFTRDLAGNEVVAVSTAVKSASTDPLAGQVMNEVSVDISAQRPKQISDALKEHFSYVVTLCDASQERFPVWPFCRNIIRWSVIDPERVDGNVENKRAAFRTVRNEIRRKVEEMLRQILPRIQEGL